jgi:hypothetical protein
VPASGRYERERNKDFLTLIAFLLCLLAMIWAWACGPVRPPVPQPTPTPIPPTTTTTTTLPPEPPVPPLVCPLQLPLTGYSLILRVEQRRASPQQYDSTPSVRRGSGPWPPLGWTGVCGTNACDLSPEKDAVHGAVCTVTLCGANVFYSISPEGSAFLNWVTAYGAKITVTGQGTLTAQCASSPSTTGSIAFP